MTRTLKDLLLTALVPLGSTMYVYGGGWNDADDGAANECRTIGANPRWKSFFEKQNDAYDFREHLYNSGCGLDCSGYVGWVLYNTLERENDRPGYVMKARDMTRKFSDRGWGIYWKRDEIVSYHPGDIMSSEDHVFISLGRCSDGSLLLLHSSPPGVMISGTVTPQGCENSDALRVAEDYMAKYRREWHRRYPHYLRGVSYLTDYDQMQWTLDGRGVLTDPDGYAIMKPEELLRSLFSERSILIR